MLDVEDWVYRYFDEVRTYGNPPTDFNVDCPFCSDGKFHMNIGMSKQVVHCWKCGYSSTWVGLVMNVMGMKYHQALGELYRKPTVRMLEKKLKKLERPVILNTIAEHSLPEDFIPVADLPADPKYNRYRKYLLGRGFDAIHWRTYNLGIAPKTAPFRIIIPIERDFWQGRAIHSWMDPKYLNPKEPDRDLIFNAQALDNYDEVVICEGAFSAMAVGENAVALVGKEPAHEKLTRLLLAPVKSYIIALEPGAFGTMQVLADALHGEGKIVTLWKYETGDPADPAGKFTEVRYGFKSKLELLLG